MIRLVTCCLVLSVSLAKPQGSGMEPRWEELARPYTDGSPQPEPRAPSPLKEPRSLSPFSESQDATLLPPTGSTDRVAHSLEPGSYYFKSTNHPSNYPNNQDWDMSLTGRQGQTISVACSSFYLESHSSCRYDYLSFNGRKFCGGPRTISAISAASISVVFHSDYSVTRSGFRCEVEVPEAGATTTTQAPSGDQCCGVANRQTRIVGGEATLVNEYPWQVGLVGSGSVPFCGGSIINNQYVLTAAHCTAGNSAGSLNVLLRKHSIGSDSNQIRVGVAQIIDHPSYGSASGTGYDYSLLRLSQTLDFSALNGKVAPVCLPNGGNFDNVQAVVSGWGRLSSGGSRPSELHDVTVSTMTNSQCRSSYGSKINPSMICAADSNKDSCQGDSGGPMVTLVNGRYNLIGVVSWGYGCADARYPGVYARVTEVSSWIQQNTAGASLC